MDPAKVRAIVEWPIPECVKDIQAFTGLTNYYRQYVERYSKITTPMTDLTRKDTKFLWSEKQEAAFQELKDKFRNGEIQRNFDVTRPAYLEADASDRAIGAHLYQKEDDGKPYPVAFHSRKLTPAEENYELSDKELLAIVDAFKTWRVHLEGAQHKVTVYSDHKNLTAFTMTKALNRQQTR